MYNRKRGECVKLTDQDIKKAKNIRAISLLSSIVYLLLITIASYTNDLILEIYSNSVWMELSFVLFITYLLLYIKDAIVNDYIELMIEKKEKAFIPHLLEHTLEPFIIYLFFLGTTWLLLFNDTEAILTRIIVVLLTPFLYFGVKKLIESYQNKTGA